MIAVENTSSLSSFVVHASVASLLGNNGRSVAATEKAHLPSSCSRSAGSLVGSRSKMPSVRTGVDEMEVDEME